jgi:hypothetical protein
VLLATERPATPSDSGVLIAAVVRAVASKAPHRNFLGNLVLNLQRKL